MSNKKRSPEHKEIALQRTPNAKHAWVLREKHEFFVNVNACTETGDTMLIHNLPLSDEEVKTLVGY